MKSNAQVEELEQALAEVCKQLAQSVPKSKAREVITRAWKKGQLKGKNELEPSSTRSTTRSSLGGWMIPEVNKVMIQMHAVMSEWERDQISARTKAALSAAKTRGVKPGITGPANLRRNIEERKAAAYDFAGKLAGILRGFQATQMSQRQMVAELNASGLKTARCSAWSLVQLQRVLKRLN